MLERPSNLRRNSGSRWRMAERAWQRSRRRSARPPGLHFELRLHRIPCLISSTMHFGQQHRISRDRRLSPCWCSEPATRGGTTRSPQISMLPFCVVWMKRRWSVCDAGPNKTSRKDTVKSDGNMSLHPRDGCRSCQARMGHGIEFGTPHTSRSYFRPKYDLARKAGRRATDSLKLIS